MVTSRSDQSTRIIKDLLDQGVYYDENGRAKVNYHRHLDLSVKCEECGEMLPFLSPRHITKVHGLTQYEYCKRHPHQAYASYWADPPEFNGPDRKKWYEIRKSIHQETGYVFKKFPRRNSGQGFGDFVFDKD